jgi:acetylornithine deacetylase/succinyl-diaminopimelate desuccinylase-like protein
MTDQATIRRYVEANAKRFVEIHRDACSIPSISTEGQGMEEMAGWLRGKLEGLGAKVTRLEVPGAPAALVGEIKGKGERTLMIYDHYDVQPVDPLDLWETPPFEPAERDGRIFARGAADNKGDLVARLCAIETYADVVGELPFNVKFFVEGEEETGSPHFEEICKTYAAQLGADHCIWEGGSFDAGDHPVMYYGCKGLLFVELTCDLLSGDQHSSLAVKAPSAAWELVRALASLKDDKGRITIDGFYDEIVEPGEREREMISKLPIDDEAELARLGVDSFVGGLRGVELLFESFYQPTANIAGFLSGYTVPGATKTVLPAKAMAKMDFRLVPDQNAGDIAAKLRRHLDTEGFDRVKVEVLSGENPSRSPMDTALGAAVESTVAEWFAQPASVQPFMVATGPMYPIAQGLGVPICSPPGVTRPDSQIHAPNENVRIADFLDIVGLTAGYLQAYGEA